MGLPRCGTKQEDPKGCFQTNRYGVGTCNLSKVGRRHHPYHWTNGRCKKVPHGIKGPISGAYSVQRTLYIQGTYLVSVLFFSLFFFFFNPPFSPHGSYVPLYDVHYNIQLTHRGGHIHILQAVLHTHRADLLLAPRRTQTQRQGSSSRVSSIQTLFRRQLLVYIVVVSLYTTVHELWAL